MRMMKPVAQATKRAVNLSLDGALVDRARALTGNLSGQVETLLAAFVESREAENEAEAERLRSAARSWNEFDERHGSFADEFSTL